MYSGRGLAPRQGPETVCTFHVNRRGFFFPCKLMDSREEVLLRYGKRRPHHRIFLLRAFHYVHFLLARLGFSRSHFTSIHLRNEIFFFLIARRVRPPLTSRRLHLTFTRIHMHAAFCSISNSCHGRFYTLVLRGGDNGDTRGVGGRGGRGGRVTLFLIILPAVPVFFQRRGFVLAAGCSGLPHVLKTRWLFAMRDAIRLVPPHISNLTERCAVANSAELLEVRHHSHKTSSHWGQLVKALFLATTLAKSCLDSMGFGYQPRK